MKNKQQVWFNDETQELTIGEQSQLGWWIHLGERVPKVALRIRRYIANQKTSGQFLLKMLEVNPKFKDGYFGLDENLGCLVVGDCLKDMPMSDFYKVNNKTQLEALRQANKHAEIDLDNPINAPISEELNKKITEIVFRPKWKEGLTLTDTINSDNVVLNISDGEYRTFHKHHVIAQEIKIDIKNIKDLVYHKVNVLLYLVGDKVKYSITSLNKKVKGVIPLYSVDIITYNGSVSETAIRDLRGMKFN